MNFKFKGSMITWRGPSPFYFIPIPQAQSKKIKAMAAQLTYGWGVIPVSGKIGKTEFTTALIPKDGVYLVPIKNLVRLGENLEVGIETTVQISLGS
ncbi:MAG: DUF1905 domain-containing protein [Actinobacteria bacterium]|nr:DUF1905 domain-containing protein [Actinomycetota bacterium]